MKRKKNDSKEEGKSKKTLKGAARLTGVMAMGLLLNGVMAPPTGVAETLDLQGFSMDELHDLANNLEDSWRIEGTDKEKIEAQQGEVRDELETRKTNQPPGAVFTS